MQPYTLDLILRDRFSNTIRYYRLRKTEPYLHLLQDLGMRSMENHADAESCKHNRPVQQVLPKV